MSLSLVGIDHNVIRMDISEIFSVMSIIAGVLSLLLGDLIPIMCLLRRLEHCSVQVSLCTCVCTCIDVYGNVHVFETACTCVCVCLETTYASHSLQVVCTKV